MKEKEGEKRKKGGKKKCLFLTTLRLVNTFPDFFFFFLPPVLIKHHLQLQAQGSPQGQRWAELTSAPALRPSAAACLPELSNVSASWEGPDKA